MLFQPTYVRPSAHWGIGNGTVDATQDLVVKWQVNGNSPMTAYQITIYENNAASTQKYTTGKISTNCPFYPVKYDGSTELFSHTISAATLSSSSITNGNEYKFIITQWWSASESVVQTSASVFYTRNAPTVTITAIPNPVTQREYSFTATYAQAQGDAMNWARWEIKDAEDNILLDTHNIYGVSQLQCDYDGFFTGQTYAIRCTVQSEKGIEVSSGWVSFAVDYETSELISGLQATCLKNKSCVSLDWAAATYIPATEVGTGSIVSGVRGEYYSMSSGDSLTWNSVNGSPMNFGIPWVVAMQGKIDNTQSGNILVVSMGADDFSLAYNATTKYLTLSRSSTTVALWQLEPTEFIFILTPTKAMLKTNCRTFGLTPSEDEYISNTLYPSDWKTQVGYYEEKTLTTTQQAITSVEAVGGALSELSYLWVFNNENLSAVESDILGSSLTQYTYKPSYDEYTYMCVICNTQNGTQGGTIITSFALTGFTLYRQDKGASSLKKIAAFGNNVTNIKDYSASSQQGSYKYYLFPMSATAMASAPLISNEINPVFWSWTLLECTENSNGEYVVQNEFTFKNNISTGSVSNNNEPNIIKNFTPYPTVQLAPHNYQSGTLTSLIGAVEYDAVSGKCEYKDTLELRDAIYNLSTKATTLFLKNRKGDVMQIRISDATEMATNDNSREQIQTMTLHWVEIGSTENKTIISF